MYDAVYLNQKHKSIHPSSVAQKDPVEIGLKVLTTNVKSLRTYRIWYDKCG